MGWGNGQGGGDLIADGQQHIAEGLCPGALEQVDVGDVYGFDKTFLLILLVIYKR